MKGQIKMKCLACGKEWENDKPLFECVQRVVQHLKDMDVPVRKCRTSSLWMLQAVVGCCDEPDLSWDMEKGEKDDTPDAL